MCKPRNWQEHKIKCVDELRLKALELEERARNVWRLVQQFETVADLGSDAIRQLASDLDVADYDDDRVPALLEIYQAGDAIMTAPGEGYW